MTAASPHVAVTLTSRELNELASVVWLTLQSQDDKESFFRKQSYSFTLTPSNAGKSMSVFLKALHDQTDPVYLG